MAYDPSFCPKLRYLEIFPIEYQGQKKIVLRDPRGYAPGVFMLPAELALALSLMDGTHNMRDIQVSLSRTWGRLVLHEELEQLISSLDTNLLLDSPHFHREKKRLEEEFLRASIRPAAHAGQAYPEAPEEAQNFVKELFSQLKTSPQTKTPRVLISPHIDLRMGARGFAAAYTSVRFPPGARLILLGTGHFLESPFSILPKDFDTPWGPAQADQKFIQQIQTLLDRDIYGDFWAHRLEHALEFQVLFLRYLGRDFRFVPILCGSPEAQDHKEDLDALAQVLGKLADEETFFIAGVDFCHLGLRYGDPWPAGTEEKKKALAYDARLLEKIFALDAQGLYEEIMAQKNRYRVCGFGPLYVLLKALQGRALSGELLHQEVVDFGPGSVVSFVAARLVEG